MAEQGFNINIKSIGSDPAKLNAAIIKTLIRELTGAQRVEVRIVTKPN